MMINNYLFCSSPEVPFEAETDQAKLSETNKQRTAAKNRDQVIKFTPLLIIFLNNSFLYIVPYLQLLSCIHFYSCLQFQEEYDRRQKGKTLLNLVVIGR